MTIREIISNVKERFGAGLGIVILAALLVEASAVVQYLYTRRLLEEQLEKNAMLTLESQVELIRHTLNSAEATMKDHLWDVQSHLSQPDSMYAVTRRLIESNPNVVGGNLAFVPDYYKEKGRLFEPYAHKTGTGIEVVELTADGHDYTLHPAFQEALKTGRKIWSDPYLYDDGTGLANLTTYSYPLADRSGRTAAIGGLDIDLSWLADTLNSSRRFPSSFSFMLTESGAPVAGLDSEREDIDLIASLLGRNIDPKDSGESHIHTARFRDSSNGRKAYVHYMHMEEAPHWQIAMVNYDKEVFAPAAKMRRRSFIMNLLGLFILFYIINRFARNRRKLLDAQVEQARIGSELSIARRIQEEMLPKVYPPFPERSDIDIYGSVEPAKEVGGDLFDFFIRDGKLFFCIGDVSGKGVPAAMIMAMTHSLFRHVAESEDSPSRIMQALNEEACRNNDSNVFVTFFIGALDLRTGVLKFCNAGHDKPVIVTQSADYIKAESNMPIGVFEDFTFEGQECRLQSPALLFLYTDGLTEARNPSREQFAGARLLKVLGSCMDADAEAAVRTVGDSVRRFMDGCSQPDDLTLLAIRYKAQKTE